MLVAKNHQKIQSRCLVHEFSFTDISNDISYDYKAALLKKNSLWLLSFYMDVSLYCYYEKVRRTMRTAVVSYLLKITVSQYIALFVVSGSIKSWVKIYFSQSVVSYLFSVDLKVWDPTWLISWFINFKYFYSFSAAELNNIESEDKDLFRNFHAKRKIMEIAMMKIFDNGIAGSLNNNYFPLNESSSLY